MTIQRLSTDLHLYLASFLDYGDKLSFGSCCLSFYHDILFSHLRNLHFYVRGKYYHERLAKCILFPERQLRVTVRKDDVPETFPFPNVYSVRTNFDQRTKTYLFNEIKKIHRLELVAYDSDLLFEMVLTDDYGIKGLIVSNEVDTEMSLPLTPPSSLEYLELNGPFSTISPEFVNTFVHLHELSLKKVANISNIHVRMFVNIPKIKLDTCENFDDITPLQFTRDISIISCTGVLDYRNSLTYSRRITIRKPNSKALIDLNCFKAVQVLDLHFSNPNSITWRLPITLKRLTIIPIFFYDNFTHLQAVAVRSSKAVTNLQPFSCIPILELTDLAWVHSLNGLGYDEDYSKGLRNRKIVIKSLDSVKDFSPLNTIETVEIISCENFHDLGQVKDVRNLTVRCWPGIIPTDVMKSEKLTLSGGIRGNLFIYLPQVRDLDISNLEGDKIRSLEGFENLKNLERIAITQCWKVRDTKGWEILLKDYFENTILLGPLISKIVYVKKIKS